MSSSDDPRLGDEERSAEQVEATSEADAAEGHAESTESGTASAALSEEKAAASVAAGEASSAESSDEPASVTDELRGGLLEAFSDALGSAVVGSHIVPGDLWVRVTADAWRDAAQLAKDRLGCTAFCFLSVIDWLPSPWGRYEDTPFDETTGPDAAAAEVSEYETGYAGGDTRFQVFMRVTNPSKGYGITIKADVADPDVGVATLIPVYPGANWHEREAHEMYGIEFVGHPNLTHIYLPGAFEGHPQRKDFPLLARQVKPWPGIVDVEPMPDADDEEPDSDETEAAS